MSKNESLLSGHDQAQRWVWDAFDALRRKSLEQNDVDPQFHTIAHSTDSMSSVSNNRVVIVDEAQCFTPFQISELFRLYEVVILLGDPNQQVDVINNTLDVICKPGRSKPVMTFKLQSLH